VGASGLGGWCERGRSVPIGQLVNRSIFHLYPCLQVRNHSASLSHK
jgi:hypothetical protein